jgi:hypothetical protein
MTTNKSLTNGKAVSQSVMPPSLRPVPKADQIDVIPKRTETLLFWMFLMQGGIGVVLFLLSIGFIGLAFKPVPDLVVDKDNIAHRVRPFENAEKAEPEQVVTFLEKRLPALYTWVGVMSNPNDSTGTTFIKDPGKEVELGKEEGSGLIPTSVYNEQFILAESIRNQTLQTIAKLLKKTNGVIWQTDPRNPFLGISYRFVFRGRPSFPKEVSPGRWKVIVNADIVRLSPTLSLTQKEETIQDFNFEVYVRRAGRVPNLFPDKIDSEQQDLVAYGKSSGFEIDWMTPFDPRSVDVPATQ